MPVLDMCRTVIFSKVSVCAFKSIMARFPIMDKRHKFLIQLLFVMKKNFALLVVAFIIFSSCNNSANDSVEKADSANEAKNDNDTTRNKTGVTIDEKSSSFLVRAANSGMAEVQLAKTAQQKATIEAVKNFAAMLERDHSNANSEVKNIAGQRNVTLPATISDDKQKMISDMEKKTGKNFD